MKMRALILVLAILSVRASSGAKVAPSVGTIISEKSVECGEKKSKKSSAAVLCQQYVVHTTTTEYQIRQAKASNQEIIPANTAIQFVIDKDKIKFKLNGKNYEFLIVGTSAITAQGTKEP